MNHITDVEAEIKEIDLAKGEDLLPEYFPELRNLSAAFIFDFVPKPANILPPEFVYVPLPNRRRGRNDLWIRTAVTITEWNSCWEAGHLRTEFIPQIFHKDFPHNLKWLCKIKNANLYLIPKGRKSAFDAYQPLYYLLPLHILKKFGLPLLRRGTWPNWSYNNTLDLHITSDFDDRVAEAFAFHIWPYLNYGSRIQFFSKDEPMVLLTHNLNFWLPCIYKLAEDRLRNFPRVSFDSKEQKLKQLKLQVKLPPDIRADLPLCGGSIWQGEKEASEATAELVKIADENGQLRAIIDTIKSNRVKDDFSNIWSYEKEDFERKLYHKRAKVRVSFIQLNDTKPVHAPTSELHENLLWEDFFALLDRKERKIVVCLKNGFTRYSEISKKLGYANHSPVSKALKSIREKAIKYLCPS
ncbi:MAG: sigma-70 family RNA polymerase sigma factor [Sedimentisphaerales bacterium]